MRFSLGISWIKLISGLYSVEILQKEHVRMNVRQRDIR